MDDEDIAADSRIKERGEAKVQGVSQDKDEIRYVDMYVQVEKPTAEKPEGVSTPFSYAFVAVTWKMKMDKNTMLC